MSAWVIALGLSAAYLMNQNMKFKAHLSAATKSFNTAAEPANPLASETIRDAQRTIPPADQYQDMNLQDLATADVRTIQGARDLAAEEVVRYENLPPAMPPIEGVFLHYDNRGI